MSENQEPHIILLFSGKRKSGKDYITDKLYQITGSKKCAILRISAPVKSIYAERHNLNFDELLSDSPYKEKYRHEMILWSDEVRQNDPGYFCQIACSSAEPKPIWIVSDIRRKTDIDWFKQVYGNKIKCIRIYANPIARESRGYVFTPGIDDVVSECDLDNYQPWDIELNNSDSNEFQISLDSLLALVNVTNG